MKSASYHNIQQVLLKNLSGQRRHVAITRPIIFNRNYSSNQKTIIVGGSIAGCMAGIQTAKLGHKVKVFEQKSSFINHKGTGIMLPDQLVVKLREMGIIPKNFQGMKVLSRPIYYYDSISKQQTLITSHNISGIIVSWGYLYRQLFNNLQTYDNCMFYFNTRVTRIIERNFQVQLLLNNAYTETANLCIFADGYNSFGRKTLFPDKKIIAANYIAWRGLFTLDNEGDFNEYFNLYSKKIIFYVYPKGHLLFYILPPENLAYSSTDKCKVNWVLYETVDQGHPYNNTHTNSSVDKLNSVLHEYLLTLVKNNFPELIVNMILKTTNPFIQNISDLFMEKVIKDKMCLLGDSGSLFRPHVGSGATKALENAIDLGSCLAKELDLDIALQKWQQNQLEPTKKLFRLGRNLGDFFVEKSPQWGAIDKEQMDDSWDKLIKNDDWYIASPRKLL